MIREFRSEDLDTCAQVLMEAYNCAPWNNHWTEETGKRYIEEFRASDNFVGFVRCEANEIIGVLLGHRRTWWTNDELYVDEFYITPQMQIRGYGKALLQHAEQHAQAEGLAGLTLSTNKYYPAKVFYEKNGYTCADHVIFMYKELK